jgi:asparagine synthase (glutamine-hydrolysing)
MRPSLPKEIIYQKKKGFPVPIAHWFKNELHQQVKDILLDSRTQERNYFSPIYVENILKRHRHGKEDLSRRILSLLILELWHRKYIDDQQAGGDIGS